MQLLIESCLLAIAGGDRRVGCHQSGGCDGSSSCCPTSIPRVADITIDERVLGFTHRGVVGDRT